MAAIRIEQRLSSVTGTVKKNICWPDDSIEITNSRISEGYTTQVSEKTERCVTEKLSKQ